jgi:hypothetical protein
MLHITVYRFEEPGDMFKRNSDSHLDHSKQWRVFSRTLLTGVTLRVANIDSVSYVTPTAFHYGFVILIWATTPRARAIVVQFCVSMDMNLGIQQEYQETFKFQVIMLDLRLPRWWLWRVLSSIMWRNDVSKEHIVNVFRVEKKIKQATNKD